MIDAKPIAPALAGAQGDAKLQPLAMRRLTQALGQAALGLDGFGVLLVIWQIVALLSQDLPGPLVTLPVLWELLSYPFYDNGPNDKGIGIQVAYSLGRVFTGWTIG